MPETTKVRKYKYKNIAAGLAVVLLITVGISTACSSKATKNKPDKDKKDKSDSSVQQAEGNEDETRLTKNYVYKEMQNGTSLNNGLLVQVDAAHPYTGNVSNAESIYPYLFDAAGEQVMSASYPSDVALPDMLKALNEMAADFAADTRLTTLMVNSMIPDDDGQWTDEAFIGSCADLMLYDTYNGTFGDFTGTDQYVWVPDNCYKYGFVMRGTNRLRYVGKDVAACIRFLSMSDGSADLEKLQSIIKDYTFEDPLLYTDDNDSEYAAYFVPIDDGSTTTSIPIPTRSDDTEHAHTISGNNVDGYIVFVNLSENAAFDEYYEHSDEADQFAEDPFEDGSSETYYEGEEVW